MVHIEPLGAGVMRQAAPNSHPNAPPPMLVLRQVAKHYGHAAALHPIELEFPPGQTTVLIGQSGCGKSTVLRLLIGLIQPDGGAVVVDGIVLTPQNVQSQRRRMGYVIQEGGLFPHLNARDNVTIMARHLRWEPARIRTRIDALSELVRLSPDALERYPVQLSGGQRQRVSVMRALMLDPDVLLLDEPLGALDPMIRAELQEDLRDMFRKVGKTVIMVTHDLAEAGFFGERIVLLREGRVVQQGTLADLTHRPADPFVTQFIRAQRLPLHVAAAGGSYPC